MSTPQQQGPQPEFIKDLFGSISQTYDLANDVMTFGLARQWRKKLVKWSGAKEGYKILDCATGTGDLALDFKNAVGETGEVIGTDFCQEMLDLAPEKSKKLNLPVKFEMADMTKLPYEDNSFDVTSVAYGIRNVEDPIKALQEMGRVTKPGGYVMILETGKVNNPIVKTGLNFYFNQIVPRLGGMVSGKKEAYEYLNKSSGQFPGKEEFLNVLKATSMFRACECKSLMGGASFIYKALK